MSDAPAPVEAAPAAPRIIPGLGTLAQQKKARSRTKAAKASSARVSSSEDGSHVAVPAQEAQATGKGQGLTLKPESLSVVEPSTEPPKRIPASVLVAKRIKATQKKLQRIYGYKDQTESLNADQQKAVATIPSLEAVIKELQEVVKVLELEESENEKLAAQKAENDEKHTQVKIAQAIHEFKKHTQSDLTLLFQFFHLNSLFSPDQASFVATQLPPVVADATGQEAAAVKTLYDAFANGPLLGGGGDDAFERLQRLTEGHDTDVIEGVSYGRIKQMTLDLTASPAEIEGDEPENQVNGYYEPQELRPEQEEAAVEAHANLLQNPPAPSLNFIQVSELEQPAAEAEPAAARSFDDSPQNFTYPPSSEQPAPATTWDEPTTAPETAKPAGQSQAWGIADSTATKQINSWADDVEAQAEPAFSGPTPATEAPTEPTVTIPDTEAAAPAERGRGRGPRRGGRGGPPPHGHPPHHPPHHHHHGHTPPPPGEDGERPRRGPPRGGRGGPRGGRPPHGHPPPPPPGEGAPVEDGWNLIHRREVSGEPPRGRGRGRGGRGRGADGEHRGGERGERGERRGRGRPAPATAAPAEA